MPKELQLYILGEFRGIPKDVTQSDMDQYGKLTRAGHTLHRLRLNDYRVYFERHEFGVVVRRILNAGTLKDFRYRSNLPLKEDEALQENPRFWALIEAAKASSEAVR